MYVDLTAYKDSIVIGSAGDIVLTAPDIERRHAELAAAPSGNGQGTVVLRALGGEVWVEHGPVLTLITGDHPLVDGDVIVIGSNRLRYRNAAIAPSVTQATREAIAWLK